MTYISMYYYFLVLAVLIIYYLFPIKHRWIALLVGNIGFYFLFYKTGWWIFGITIIISFFAGIALKGFEGKTRKLILILALLAIIAPWFLSKNFNFILKIAQKDPIQWITPLGISFYTLQLISYNDSYYAAITDYDTVQQSGSKLLKYSGSTRKKLENFTIVSGGFNAGAQSSIKIGDTEYGKNLDGVNIVVYSQETRKVIDSVVYDGKLHR